MQDIVAALESHNGIVTAVATAFIALFTLPLRQATDRLWNAGKRQLVLTGRLRSISDANVTTNDWYLFADPARVPNFVYGFLAGSGGPRTRTFEPFGVQGVKVSLEHDFGCGAIDYRAGDRNAGQ